MTEEERKAVEQLKKDMHIPSDAEGFWFEVYCDARDIETVLNIIKRQEKEISNLQKQIDLMALTILTYDWQLVLNTYRNKDDVKKRFKDMVEKE